LPRSGFTLSLMRSLLRSREPLRVSPIDNTIRL
jgi:hypothetical protein